jgi:hypothetical protein
VEDWQEIEFEKVGPWNVGNILVNDIQPGEYTFAVKEAVVGTSDRIHSKKNALEVYPNPSSGDFTIICRAKTGGEIRIFSDTGELIKVIEVHNGKEQVNWSPEGQVPGSYFIALYQDGQAEPVIYKVIYLP